MDEVEAVALLVVCLSDVNDAQIPSPSGPGEVDAECL